MTMTDKEFAFMVNDQTHEADHLWFQAGIDCYENGWIDAFGLVTPKGEKAIDDYVETHTT